MKRDRRRTEVTDLLLKLLLSAGAGTLDGRMLAVGSFAKEAGLSRQAMYESHRDVVNALGYLSKLRSQGPDSAEVRESLRIAKEQRDENALALAGSTKQNLELVGEIYALRAQLKKRGLAIVPPS